MVFSNKEIFDNVCIERSVILRRKSHLSSCISFKTHDKASSVEKKIKAYFEDFVVKNAESGNFCQILT